MTTYLFFYILFKQKKSSWRIRRAKLPVFWVFRFLGNNQTKNPNYPKKSIVLQISPTRYYVNGQTFFYLKAWFISEWTTMGIFETMEHYGTFLEHYGTFMEHYGTFFSKTLYKIWPPKRFFYTATFMSFESLWM